MSEAYEVAFKRLRRILRRPTKPDGLGRSCAFAVTLLAALGLLYMAAKAHSDPDSRIDPGLYEGEDCTFWVAPPPAGNDSQPGSAAQPWATLHHASESVPDNNCLIWFADGTYFGNHRLNRRFETTTTFKAIHPYQAILENDGSVVNISGGTHLTLEGFVFQHDGPGASQLVVIVDGSSEGWSEHITLRNNIFRDSYNNDLLKLLDGVRYATVEHNLFYNQGPNEEHIDVNSVTDVRIQDNIFFNDYAGSGRTDPGDTKSFITVKDSNEGSDGLLGSERVTIRRNVFLNWQGDAEPFLQIGNDGKPYHEAEDVFIENNLMIGNSSDDINALLAVSGAKNVFFVANTVVGDLPSRAYAFRVDQKGSNPPNENLYFNNNIWSDPTGTMGAGPASDKNEFSDGDPDEVISIVLDNNLYWNGGEPIPPGEVATPLIDDAHRVVGDPLLALDQSAITLPRWQGTFFSSGNHTIRQEFVRLVMSFARIPETSTAVDQANPAFAPPDDILGRPRPAAPDIGAYEHYDLDRSFQLPLIMN